MVELEFSTEAYASWEHILDSDPARATAIDHWLARIEDNPQDPELRIHSRPPHGYLIDVPVPGRNGYSLIVWTLRDDGTPWILHVGKSIP